MLLIGEKRPKKETYFQVQATLVDSKKCKGYRGSLFKCAQHCLAYHSLEGDKRSIFYQEGSSNLSIRLLFASREKAEIFQNELFNFGYLHSHFREKLRMEENISEIEAVVQPARVFHHHYMSADNTESPEMSLNDVFPTSPSVSAISIGKEPRCSLQAIEEERIVRQFDSKWYKCHLISGTNKKFVNNHDNVIFASGTFHQLFDGLNTSAGVGVLLKFCDFGADEMVLIKADTHETRRKIIVEVIFRDRDIANSFGMILKSGSEKICDNSYRSFLYATNGDTMKHCLEQKYHDSWLENITSVSEDGY